MSFYPTIIFFLSTRTFLCTLYVPSCSTNEVDALLKWKATLQSQNNNTLSWIVSPCNWYGVLCNENGTVDSLSFLLFFPNIVYFELSSNYFYGIIPSDIGHLSKLTDLILSKNQLSGPIPAEIGILSSLKRLELKYNNLSDPLPKELGNLVLLSRLHFAGNQLNRSIPKSFGNLKNSEYLILMENRLSGPIPEEFGKLKLVRVEMGTNRFSGNLPEVNCIEGKLERFNVNDNNLTRSNSEEFI